MCDILVLYVLKSRDYYRDSKYLNVSSPGLEYDMIQRDEAQEVRM